MNGRGSLSNHCYGSISRKTYVVGSANWECSRCCPVLRSHEFNVIVFLTLRLSVSISRVFSALSVQFARRGGHRTGPRCSNVAMDKYMDIHAESQNKCSSIASELSQSSRDNTLDDNGKTATDRRASGHCSVCGHCRAAMRGTFGKAEVARGSSCQWLLPLLALLRARCLPPRIRSIIVLRLPDRIA